MVLSRNQSAGAGVGDDIQLELSFGAYNNESIRNYSTDSVFSRMGRSVGRLDILTDAGIFPCTAFIVDKKYLLTNYHCVPGILDNAQAKATRIDAVQFVAGYVQQGVEEGTEKFIVSPTPVESNQELDYSILEVIGNPSAKYGMLALSDREPHDRDPYWVIGHPMGEAQRISREQCRANAPALSGNQLLHTCDTLPGNSGSPVIDASLQKVIGLHHAGSKKDSVNFAIPMRLILARSAYLKAAVSEPPRGPINNPGVTPPPTDPTVQVGETGGTDICDALYAEAKAYAACFAYRAYANSCTNHPYVGFASAYIEDNCAVDEPDPKPPVDIVSNPPYTPPAQPAGPLRPWCTSSRLNPTESTICANDYLASLDIELEQVYNRVKTSTISRQQRDWLKNSRDACGAQDWCIETAYEKRIAALSGSSSNPNPSPTQSYTLPSHQCYIVVASRTSVQEARQFIYDRLQSTNGVRMFLSDNGYYGITVATVSRSEADWRLSQMKSQNKIPGDSFCSSGNRYIQEIAWQSGSNPQPTPSPSPSTLYVDNNNDGGLNLRSGPGSNYQITHEMEAGLKVTQLKTQGTWSNLRLPDGRTGWAATRYLTYSKPTVRICNGQVKGLRPASTYSSNNGQTYLWMRSSPSSSKGNPLAELYQGDRVRVVAQRNGWALVQCVSGQCTNPYRGSRNVIGWSSQKYLNIWCN